MRIDAMQMKYPSGGIVRSDQPAFAFKSSNLSHVQPSELQPYARPHAVGFFDNDYAEVVKAASYCLDLFFGIHPGAPTAFYAQQRFG